MLEPPFPYFGSKRRVTEVVWARLGQVGNYVEPFCGSAAMLLGRPDGWEGFETLNDRSCLVANFLRAVRENPTAVAALCDDPVSELDLSARHRWLLAQRERLEVLLEATPFGYDARAAAWWVWGHCYWTGQGWCEEAHSGRQLPHLYGAGRGMYGLTRRDDIPGVLERLSRRLHRVRVICGDWTRVLGPSVTWKTNGTLTTTAVFLDPPYPEGAVSYAAGGGGNGCQVWAAARAWAVENGDNARLRIAFCGYDTPGQEMGEGWTRVSWKAKGGYGGQGAGTGTGRRNALREVVWFSPACLAPVEIKTPATYEA